MARPYKTRSAGLRCPREQDHDSCPPARFAFHVNKSAVCGNDAADGGESQTSALAGVLSGEKRLEKTLAYFRVHTATVVADHEENAGEGFAMLFHHGPGYGLEFAVAGLNHNAATGRQRVTGVEDQVEDDLLGLRRIDLD